MLEVYPGGVLKRLSLLEADSRAILESLTSRGHLPLAVDERIARQCLGRRDALEAVIAARCAANAVLTGEGDRNPDELAPEEGSRVSRTAFSSSFRPTIILTPEGRRK